LQQTEKADGAVSYTIAEIVSGLAIGATPDTERSYGPAATATSELWRASEEAGVGAKHHTEWRKARPLARLASGNLLIIFLILKISNPNFLFRQNQDISRRH